MTSALHIRSSSTIDEAADIGRHIRDLAVDEGAKLIKRADLPHLVEVGKDGVASAASGAIDRVTGRRRSRRPGPILSVTLVATSLAIGVGAWWFLRSDRFRALRGTSHDVEDFGDPVPDAGARTPDSDALARATDDGMGIVGVTSNAAIPVAPRNGHFGAATRELATL
jgi:hypothetical protein